MVDMKNRISSQKSVSVGTSAGSFLPAIPNRIGLIISPPQSGLITLSLEKQASPGGAGVSLYPGNDPLILTASEHGDLPSRAWTAIGASAETIGVIEIFITL